MKSIASAVQNYYTELITTVPRLSKYNSAKLLCDRSTRKFVLAEMYGGIYFANDVGDVDAMRSFGENSIVNSLDGNPELIEGVAEIVQDKNLLEYEEKLCWEIIPELKDALRGKHLWKYACGLGSAGKWSDIAFWLSKFFHTGGVGGRKLGAEELKFLEVGGGGAISRGRFETFWNTFTCYEATIRRIGDEFWTGGGRVMGFVSRERSSDLLLGVGVDVGTFLIRFSSNEPSALVIAFVASIGNITNVKLTPDCSSENGWVIDGSRRYENIEKLVEEQTSLGAYLN